MLIILFQALTESQNLSMFLAKQGSIREELKKAMEKIKECLHKIGNLVKVFDKLSFKYKNSF